MTEEIDLDDLEVETDEEPEPNPGDWFWRGEGDPAEEPAPDPIGSAAVADPNDGVGRGVGSEADGRDGESETTTDRVPHVPRKHGDSPVGIPVGGGGAGARSAREAADQQANDAADTDDTVKASGAADSDTGIPEASGPHGGDVDELTIALTYKALHRLEDPQRVIADTTTWADWVGIVGDVEAYVINTFQRDHRIDVDFFNGASQGPAERLAAIDQLSMFFAERMVLVGLPEESWMTDSSTWEFVAVSEAARKADWALTDDCGDDEN